METLLKILCPACGEVLELPNSRLKVTVQENAFVTVTLKADVSHNCPKVNGMK